MQAMPLTQSMPKPVEYNRLAEGADPSVLADIYNDGIDIAIWKRELSASITDTVTQLIAKNPSFRLSTAVTPGNAREVLAEALERFEPERFEPERFENTESADSSVNDPSVGLSDDIAELVGMFCMLFDVERAGVRLGVLETAMCPKFHVDRIPCRLLTTYQGVATEWLPHEQVDRSKLGHGSNGKLDHESGLFMRPEAIQQLNEGDVAILKGDLWEGNEGNGLVHRSPCTDSGRRLLLTMDLMD